MAKLKQKDIIENFKNEIKNSKIDSLKIEFNNEKHYGTMYIKEKMDYGFHIYFIHEPNQSEFSGKDGIVTEMYYDLRNKIYWIKRNHKEVRFNVRNVDSVFPDGHRTEIFEFLSTETNKNLYHDCYRTLSRMGLETTNMVGRFMHRLITEYPCLEILHKAKLPLDLESIRKRRGNSPMEILGLTKSQWKMIKKHNLPIHTFSSHYFTQFADKGDSILANYLGYIEKLEDKYGTEVKKDFIDRESSYIYQGGSPYYGGSALHIAKTRGLPDKKLVEYLYFQCDVEQALVARSAISLYSDYYRMSMEMNDINLERYPKTLRLKHDIVARNYNVKLSLEEEKKWKDRFEILKKDFTWKYKEFIIFPPEESSDLKKEGNAQSNCVGSYVGSHLKGNCTILFLRKKEEIQDSLVTIEIRNNKIVQAKRKYNHEPKQEHQIIMERFADKMDLDVYWKRHTEKAKKKEDKNDIEIVAS